MKIYLLIILITSVFSILGQSRNEFYSYRVKDKWGFADSKGNLTIKPKYDSVSTFYEHWISGIYWAKIIENGKESFIDIKGRYIIPPIYDKINIAASVKENDFILIVKKGDFYGIVDKNYNSILPFKYDSIFQSQSDIYDQNDIFYCLIVNNWYRISLSQRENKKLVDNNIINKVKEPVYFSDYDFSSNEKNHLPSKIQLNDFKKTLPFEIDSVGYQYHIYTKYYPIYYKGKIGLISKQDIDNGINNYILKPNYDSITAIENLNNLNIYIVYNNGKSGIVSEKDSIIIPLKYDRIIKYFAGSIITEEKGFKGVYNLETNNEIKPKYKTLEFKSKRRGITLLTTFDYNYKDCVNSDGTEYFKN